jgi:hypothetical protein
MDYLATPAVAAYFDAREHEAYYRALKRVGLRRDFHEQLIQVCERFIELTDSGEGSAAVDRAITAAQTGQRQTSMEGVLKTSRTINRRGVELLHLVEPVTFDSLKAAYRVAAKRNHPDLGGEHEAMVAINEAFGLIHNLLREEQMGSDASDGPDSVIIRGSTEVRTCADYRYVCGALLFLATLDDWNVDSAWLWLNRITSDPWQAPSPYARDRQQLLALTEPSGRLATRLAIARQAAEARRALSIAQGGLRVAQEEGLIYEQYVREAEAALAGTKRAKVVINHPRQANHALRLGVIDEKQYRKAVDKHASTANDDSATEIALRRFQAEGGFLPALPRDRIAVGKVVRGKLVPEPGYFVTRIAQLTDDQQAEYLRAFASGGSLALVRKYTFVRLVSLLESVLFHPSEVSAAVAAREASALGKLHTGSGPAYAGEVASVISDLSSRPASEQEERAKIVTAIEDRAGDARGIRISLSGADIGSPLGMPLSTDYMKLIRRPISDLRQFRQRGVLSESVDERRASEAWARDHEALHSPVVQASNEAAFAATDMTMTDPEGAIAVWKPHCELLMALGESMVHVEQLQLGYWIDRISAALVRVKRWDEAIGWLEKYYGLPERYRGRSSASEDERLKKRLERCRRKLAET